MAVTIARPQALWHRVHLRDRLGQTAGCGIGHPRRAEMAARGREAHRPIWRGAAIASRCTNGAPLRRVEIPAGRSINLALANRGIAALAALGLMDDDEDRETSMYS